MYHNAMNYAHGLLDELEGALRAGRDDVAEAIHEELAAVRPEVDKVDPKALDDDAKTVHGRLQARLAQLDEAPAPASTGPAAETKPAGRGRTARAAAAPEAAVPPKPE